MKYDIIFSPIAAQDLRSLSAFERSQVRDAIERHLRHQPKHISRSRIKRLRGFSKPQYRLRVGDFRVFYDVVEKQVQILIIVNKKQAEDWLNKKGVTDEKNRPR
jgi:mRNA-degrading endonuclease RelE of RelBE toxin-antitoxin system